MEEQRFYESTDINELFKTFIFISITLSTIFSDIEQILWKSVVNWKIQQNEINIFWLFNNCRKFTYDFNYY